MKPHTLTAGLLLLVGCDGESDHDHGHDHAEAHAAPTAAPAPTPAPPSAAPTTATPQPQSLGSHQAQLTTTDAGLRLTLRDASGADVAPTGEVRVVLTGTGEDEQRVVLQPDGTGWAGAARVQGASGYVAVVSLEVAGHTETTRFAWGEVPAPAPAPTRPAPTDDDHGADDEHGHGHGH